MAIVPDLGELRATLSRMEERYGRNPIVGVSYARLCRRFADDLLDERDVLLSKCAALMMIKFMEHDGLVASDASA